MPSEDIKPDGDLFSLAQMKLRGSYEHDYARAVDLLAAWIVEHADAAARPFSVNPANMLTDALNRIRSADPFFGLDDADAGGSGNGSPGHYVE